MRLLAVTLLFSTLIYAQEKSKIITSNETIVISYNKNFDIESSVNESRLIAKSKNTEEYNIQIPFDSFNEISDIKGSTFIVSKSKKKKLSSAFIGTYDVKQDDIFKSDYKFKNFVLPDVEDNSVIEYSYKNKYKEPRFLSSFRFQNYLKTEVSSFIIKCDSKIEIGFKLFGNFQDKIVFTKTKEGDLDVYTWEAKDLPEFEPEEDMPSSSNFMPHIIYYIKSYNDNGVTTPLLGTPGNLYNWYTMLLKDINKVDEKALKEKTLALIKDDKNDYDKAKTIYNWVQYNLHYVAFENGMNGFVPRDAAAVFEKRYGDCKDMANLLNQMLHYAGLESSLTWLGTRSKPYTYNDVPTPQVDNHMIVNTQIGGKSYFLDATDKFCPFGYPSSMIQGKEALIGKGNKDFKIETISVVDPNKNKIEIALQLEFIDTNLVGEATTLTSGLFKSDLLNSISAYNQKTTELWKYAITANNKRIALEPKETIKNDYSELPSKAVHQLKLEKGLITLNDKLLFKPIIILPFKDANIDTQKRKFSIESDYAQTYDIQYQIKLPAGYKVELLPENKKMSNDLASFDFQYKLEKGILKVSQKIQTKKIILENKDFDQWNTFIKELNKQYNQSILLIK
ncbi:hypothetical protein HNP99_000801 [Flavobacterium sp. 28A]|uniref:DUF3857 domain-containing protein n=1 Tax=Flavobacterium sp. 28A TaxID=2735895 RepID=UPI00156DD7AD|nr:DUF3857 domain-containing protein [Flavobacterium sp. 28A]NRT14461.1 hypothetical protein [Flavobacterium sp. 28A]